jgi:hypothetical protein
MCFKGLRLAKCGRLGNSHGAGLVVLSPLQREQPAARRLEAPAPAIHAFRNVRRSIATLAARMWTRVDHDPGLDQEIVQELSV